MSKDRKLCRILGVGIDRVDVEKLLEKVKDFVREKTPHEIFYVNADCINRSFFDAEYKKLLEGADLVYPDGIGVVWASRYTATPFKERVNLGDFLPKLCDMCQRQGYSIFILAGKDVIAKNASENLKKDFPKLNITGTHHGYFTEKEEEGLIEEINKSACRILLVGLGVPKQEKWIHKNKHRLNATVLWGVGALFDYYSLSTKRAPYWMKRMGFEWLFRLILEPKRLWRRYVFGNIFFIWRVFMLLLLDAVFVSLAWIGAYWVRYALNSIMPRPINPFGVYFKSLPFVIILWIATCAYFNLYTPRWERPSRGFQFFPILKAVTMGLLVAMSLSFLLKEFDFGRSVILIWGVFSFALLFLSRIILWFIDTKKGFYGHSK